MSLDSFFAGQVWNNISQNIVRILGSCNPDNCSGVNWRWYILHILNKKYEIVDFLFSTISADTICQFDTIKIHGAEKTCNGSFGQPLGLTHLSSFPVFCQGENDPFHAKKNFWNVPMQMQQTDRRQKKSFFALLCETQTLSAALLPPKKIILSAKKK